MRSPWVVLATSAALLTGCGGGDATKGRALELPAGRPLLMVADEYSFDPARVTVAQGGELRLTLRNEGSLAHDVRVLRGGRDVGGTPAFEGGRRTTRLRLSRGRYRFVCTVGDHEQLGMRGTLTVR